MMIFGMMKEFLMQLVIGITIFYLMPTLVCVVFAILHHKDNPFDLKSGSSEWAFMPFMNIACMVAIIIYIIVELICKNLWRAMKRAYNGFLEWNKD